MCTAAAYRTKGLYFGRTLDHDATYGEEIVILPRNRPLRFREMGRIPSHYAMIGMAHVAEGEPLYYEAMNESGLGMAGLNFVGNAHYFPAAPGFDNVAPFEFIPWILCQCATVAEARGKLKKLRLTDTPFSADLPLAQLHWMLADRAESVVVESTEEGLRVYDDPADVLSNNPPFPLQMFQLNNYMRLSPDPPRNTFCAGLPLEPYSRGMGALGLPGDTSSQSRFIRAAFVRGNSVSGNTEEESVRQFFHILGAVEQPRGCSRLSGGGYEITVYTCCSGSAGVYYYTTYENRQITAVDMRKEDLDSSGLIRYPMLTNGRICRQN